MTPDSAWPRWSAWAVAALVVAWLAATAWVRPLMLPDEGRYVGVAWEMLRSGDWLTPTLDGLPYFHKPPLFYWITAASLSVFGPHEWAARAAPVLGASLGAMALYLFTRRWRGERLAGAALLGLLVQPVFYLGGQFANLDMLVAGCITATILLFAHAALSCESGAPDRRALAGAYAMAALGVLAKGLIGAVIPALVLLTWLLSAWRWRTLAALLGWWPGPLIFLVLAAPWFVAMQNQFADFAHYFFVVQHFKRFAAGGFNNAQPVWFYPVLLLVVSLPWLPWLYRGVVARATPAAGAPASMRRLMLSWVGVVLLFFSLPQSKLIGYILPAVPPLAFLIAEGFWQAGSPPPRARRWWWLSAALVAAIGLGVVAALAGLPQRSTREIALALAAQRSQDEPVYMLHRYDFDLPFYARLATPVRVIDDWSSPQVQQSDNWRKELADAGQFAAAHAAATLLPPAALPGALCQSRVSWVIGPAAASLRYPFLAQASARATHRDTRLWRLDTALPALASALACAERPSGGSTSK